MLVASTSVNRECTRSQCFLFFMVITFLYLFYWVIQIQNKGRQINLARYNVSMSAEDKRCTLLLLRRLVEAVEKANLTYFMYHGSLLGAYRHHGFIPWDDDVDILFDYKDKGKLITVLQNISPVFDVWYEDGPTAMKFFYKELKHIFCKPFSYPFVDMYFYLSNDTHIWDGEPDPFHAHVKSHVSHRKCDVFPLTRRPFEDLMLPAPCDTQKYLSTLFNPGECVSRWYFHQWNFPIPQFMTSVEPCERLYDHFSFARRKVFKNRTSLEYVAIGDTIRNITYYINTCACDET